MGDQPTQEQIDELMRQLASGGAAAPAPVPPPPAPAPPLRPSAARLELEPLVPAAPGRPESGLEFLSDVDVELRVELGSATLNVQEILKLSSGSVVGLETPVGEPVGVYVNDRLVARGEILVVNETFAVRITEVVPAPGPGTPPAK